VQILNRVQESDDACINFVKYNFEKMGRQLDQLGKELRGRSEEINQNLHTVSSDTDIKIFIDNNKSKNHFLLREEFQHYDNLKQQPQKRTSQHI